MKKLIETNLTESIERIANERKTGLYGISPPRKLNNPFNKTNYLKKFNLNLNNYKQHHRFDE